MKVYASSWFPEASGMIRSEPPVNTAPGLSALLPGIGKKPSLPLSSGFSSSISLAPPGTAITWATSPLATTPTCGGSASSESFGPLPRAWSSL